MTENILVLRSGKGGAEFLVKEGNRRVAALKFIFGHLACTAPVPTSIQTKIKALTAQWKAENSVVPCAIYKPEESVAVDRIVSLTHGKGDRAGRDKWKPVAKARHNRDQLGGSEPSLDLLEKYLKSGQNITPQQKERWAGDYPLTVLDEAMKRLSQRLGLQSAKELAEHYPGKVPHRTALEEMLRQIGLSLISFDAIRGKTDDDAFLKFGFPSVQATSTGTSATNTGGSVSSGTGTSKTSAGATTKSAGTGVSGASTSKSPKAVAINDPVAVTRALKAFFPRGNKREKLTTLLVEARKLNIKKHPHAFCFVLRSMFEISAKAYCEDHSGPGGPKAVNNQGEDRKLVEVLRDVTNHLTNNKQNKPVIKALHGALAELAKPEGFLSVTSMNQLVHNTSFTVDATHIATLFGNIFPLLDAMNS